MEAIEKAGGQIIIMASRAVAALGGGHDQYLRIYQRLIESAAEPVILHWLGDMFDPALKGYWGSDDLDKATQTVVFNSKGPTPTKLTASRYLCSSKIGKKNFEDRCPTKIRVYTGDDFNYAALIEGDGDHYSHALLGIFAAIAPAASQGLAALAAGNSDEYHRLLAPTVPLSREIFKAPTQYYKAGIAFFGLAKRCAKALCYACRSSFSARNYTLCTALSTSGSS